MWSKAAWVMTCSRVARIAAMDSPLPARVPPIPPTSMSSSSTERAILSATSRVNPKVPQGIPPPIDLPMVIMSGCSDHSRVHPP